MEHKKSPSCAYPKKYPIALYGIKVTPGRIILFLCLLLCTILIIEAIYKNIFHNKQKPSIPFTDPLHFVEYDPFDKITNKTPFFDFSIKASEEAIMSYESTLAQEISDDFISSLIFEEYNGDCQDNLATLEKMKYNHRSLRQFLGFYEFATQHYSPSMFSEIDIKELENAISKGENGSHVIFECLISYDFFKAQIKEDLILKDFLRYNFEYHGWSFDINSNIYWKLSRIAKLIHYIYEEILGTLEQYIFSVTTKDTLFEPGAILYLFKFGYGIVDKQCLNLVLFIFEVVREDNNIERLKLRDYFEMFFPDIEKRNWFINEILTRLEKMNELLHATKDWGSVIFAARGGEGTSIAAEEFLCWLEKMDREYESFSSGVREVIEIVSKS